MVLEQHEDSQDLGSVCRGVVDAFSFLFSSLSERSSDLGPRFNQGQPLAWVCVRVGTPMLLSSPKPVIGFLLTSASTVDGFM